MKRTAFLTAATVLSLIGGLFAYPFAFATGGRADCPGKIICPITGAEICKDQCPVIDPNRSDCPGKIECPVTGDLVCRDRCPIGAEEGRTGTVPSCCAQGR